MITIIWYFLKIKLRSGSRSLHDCDIIIATSFKVVSFCMVLTMPKKQKRPIIPINQHTEDHSIVSTYTFVTKQNNERWMTTVCQRGGHRYVAFIVSILLQIVSYISIIILKTLIYILIRCKTLRHKMTI